MFLVSRHPRRFIIGFTLLLGLAGLPGAAALALDRAAITTVQDQIYEVVVRKPEHDPLSYERPLPLELLPYTVRTDKYISTGTAFLIAPNRLLSAAHVLRPGFKSQYPTPQLRDRHGKVHDIGQVHQFDMRRDFIVFSLKNPPSGNGLPHNLEPVLNDKVYAVGNAHGEGVVFRDGLYTSDTPEQMKGAWKWLRFSAAASPGNSGGPLLNERGEVIGVVLRKSENENLNYALPIREVRHAPNNMALVEMLIGYRLDNMDMTRRETFLKQVPLPRDYAVFHRDLTADLSRFYAGLLKAMLAEHQSRIFPNGPGASAILHRTRNAIMPGIIAKGDDGQWDMFLPKATRADLEGGGTLIKGSVGNMHFTRLRRPDAIPQRRLYADSKLHMDLMLQGIKWTRPIGAERIRITSLGKAAEERWHVDHYDRRWLVRIWNIPHVDQKVILVSLPTPEGFVSFMRGANTTNADEHVADLLVLTNFFYVSYYGTLAQWREFLRDPGVLPRVFQHIALTVDYRQRLRLNTRRFTVELPAGAIAINEDSDLSMRFSYFRDGARTVWDIGGVVFGDHKNTGTAFSVFRNPQPAENLSAESHSDWDKLVKRQHPYDRKAFQHESRTVIASPITSGGAPESLASKPVIYTGLYIVDGTHDQQNLESRLGQFVKGVTILER